MKNLKPFGVDLSHARHQGLRPHSIPRPHLPRTVHNPQKFRVERARYAKAEDAYRVRVQNLSRNLISGNITPDLFLKTLKDDMYRFYSRMYILGRRAVGNLSSTLSKEEQAYLHGQHSIDMRFLHNFVRDVVDGKGKMRYDLRADLYGLGGYSIYLFGAVNSVVDGRWEWEINLGKESCPDCIENWKASMKEGGFTTQRLKEVGLPGTKRCLHRCRCGLSLIGGPRLARTRSTRIDHIKDQIGIQ